MGLNRMTGTSWQVEKARSKDSIYRKKCVNCIHYSLGWCKQYQCSITTNNAGVCPSFENFNGENPDKKKVKKRIVRNLNRTGEYEQSHERIPTKKEMKRERSRQLHDDIKNHPEKFKIVKMNKNLSGRKKKKKSNQCRFSVRLD